MSAFVYHEIACDYGWRTRALRGRDGTTGHECYKAYSDMGTATQVRRRAKAAGWGVNLPGGSDRCPDHKGKRWPVPSEVPGTGTTTEETP